MRGEQEKKKNKHQKGETVREFTHNYPCLQLDFSQLDWSGLDQVQP